MALGEKIRQARLEAGLSQRQLCSDEITRNMLSQIENGSARPSMDTLRFLAARLGKSVSFFLEEDTVTSPNQQVMAQAWQALEQKHWEQVLSALEDFREPDPLFCRERQRLTVLATLKLAEEGLEQGKIPYARQLLEELGDTCQSEEFRRRRLLLLGRCAPEKLAKICRELPSLDEELLLRAADALNRREYGRSEQLLEAAENKNTSRWNLLRGQTYLARGQFTKSAVCYLKAEAAYPEECWPGLERCYRELGNYQKAYEYACKQKAPS